VTRLLFVKLFRDLRMTRGRIALMLIAISVSLVVFGTALYMRTIVSREMNGADFAGAHPASATLLLDPGLDPDQLAAVRDAARARPDVIDATLRRQLETRIQAGDGRWSPVPLQVFVAAPDDPMRVSRFQLQQGAWPPPRDGILIERDALSVLHVQVGDTLVVADAGGAPLRLTVAGVVHDPTLPPASQERRGYGYVSTTSELFDGQRPTLDELKILVAGGTAGAPTTDRDAIQRTAESLGVRLAQTRGIGVALIQVPPDQNPHVGWMRNVLSAVLGFGTASVLLSALLLAAMLNGLLVQQRRQIGILKAVGARSNRVVQLFLTMVLLVAGTATALAFVPGIAVGRTLSRMVLRGQLNMDVTSFDVPWWNYAAVVAVGVLLPLLMALAPLARASRTTVREAMDDHGVSNRMLVATRFDAALGRFRRLDRTVLIGLRNALRRRGRSLLLVGLLATAGSLVVGGLSTWTGLQSVARSAARQPWDVRVQLSGPASAAALASTLGALPHVTGVETSTTVPMAVHVPGRIDVTHTYPDQGHGAVSMTSAALDPRQAARHAVVGGRWLRPGDTDAVVVSEALRRDYLPGAGVGDTVRLSVGGRPSTWHVVGVVDDSLEGANAFVSEEGLAAATGRSGEANVIRISIDHRDPATQAAVAEEAGAALESASISVQASQPAAYFVEVINGHAYILSAVILLAGSVIAVLGCVGLASTMSANVLERTREFGVMHAIGARPSAVRRVVVSEAVVTALASCVVAAVPTVLFTIAMDTAIGRPFNIAVPFQIWVPGALGWTALVVIGSVLATLAPAARASRLTVRDALAAI
jgi:putative ABC transport system permease protein